MEVIRQIADSVESVEGVKLLDIDPGRDTNRTVVTFAGDPDAVAEAAFRSVKKASELIDMSKHKGEHPRMGAADVCPFIPVSGITMKETVNIARKVAGRIGNELKIPVFCYENAAFTEKRRNLASCREGEYEGLGKKLADPEWKPDFGPDVPNIRSGATAVGARDFLVAFNINLNTTSKRLANAIAFDVREKGRYIINDENEKVNVPGTLKSVKAIGWYMEEYGIAQISMNLTDISVTPVHIAFDEVCRKAEARGVRVTGSELVGLIPLKSLLDAGTYFLEKQHRSAGVSEEELIKIAVKSMGLSELHPFDPEKKIIEYVLEGTKNEKLTTMSLSAFMNSVAAESPAPGGGSVGAYIGALGMALGTMVANISGHKRGWDDRWKEFSDQAVKSREMQNKLLDLVNKDTEAFNRIIEARRMPKKTNEEIKLRDEAIQNAYKEAILVPFAVMETAFSGFDIIHYMIENGDPAAITDAAVGGLALRSCIRGAFLNIKTNAGELIDETFIKEIILKAGKIDSMAYAEEEGIINYINSKIMTSVKR